MKPRATYRLQFHQEFPFAAAAKLAGYFHDLGVSHVYASPILTARKGSTHGYDVVDHKQINPELGGEEGFVALALALREQGIGLIVDIVPNHVAVGKADNAWWLDLLQNGPASNYGGHFDIDWDTPGLEGKVFAPFLGEPPEKAWDKGTLRLIDDRALGKRCFAYFDHRFPLRPEDQQLRDEALTCEDAMAILARQNFVVADWREADQKINWRRFFDITDLAAIRVLNPQVFEATHAKMLSLYAQGLIDGLRVDHVDGISDPAAYCRTLRQRMEALRRGGYLVIEKILAPSEALSKAWGVDGTTGYDFMNDVSAVLHRPDGGKMEELWRREGAREKDFETEEFQAREEMLTTKFASQLDATVRAFQPLISGVSPPNLESCLISVIAELRCYRSYATGGTASPGPGSFLLEALDRARERNQAMAAIFLALRGLFERTDGDIRVMDALRRFSQLSAPVAAKAVEDTAFYRYGRLLSRNDVGFDPRQHRLRVTDFHTRMWVRAQDFPDTLLALSTHDHKRGSETRARLAALPLFADQWDRLVRSAPRPQAIHPADAYQLYQTILGAWPGEASGDFVSRILGWSLKYLREAKLRSTWSKPDTGYEKIFCDFGKDVLVGPAWEDWRKEFVRLLEALALPATRNQIVQSVLQLTLPGIPDVYQGSEFEDLSLVDPDNRRPVDYGARIQALASQASLKQNIIVRLLRVRRAHQDLWSRGTYEPVLLPALDDSVIAYRRRYRDWKLMVVCCLTDLNARTMPTIELGDNATELLSGDGLPVGQQELKSILKDRPAAAILSH